MRPFASPALRTATACQAALTVAITIAHALQIPTEPSRFDAIARPDPSVVVSPAPIDAKDAAQAPESLRAGWAEFEAAHGKSWDVTIDARSGAPLLVQGEGIPLIPGMGNSLPKESAAAVTLDSLAATLREFLDANAELAKTDPAELDLDREGSGAITPDLWKVVFDRTVAGIPVAGDRWVFYVGHGNLIAFGASRWSTITASPIPALTAEAALAELLRLMGIGDAEKPVIEEAGSLRFVPTAAAGTAIDSYQGPVGAGYETALAWRFVLEVPDEPGRWTALVDAHTGALLTLQDTNQYAYAKGGVNPITNDGICPDGCEQPDYPMPFTNITIAGNASASTSMGSFSCAPGGATAATTLAGTYVRVADSCGSVSQTVLCDASLDLKSSSGTDCTVPAGASAGNTHAARSSFYHLNRIKEHARAWLPANTWLPRQLVDNVNLNQTCNAFWNDGGLNGTVNFYRSGGGCRNTGEIASVFLHEWGHGLDQNDGGGYDNPSEAYADVTSFFMTHKSCIGRGFNSSNCGGYGNACLSCTGVRDQDWDQHASHAPQTPESWPASCPTGTGPCGREVHCEAYLSGEAVWDLAARDLPASGLDAQTAWEIADRLWFKSRTGSGGNVYSCGAPAASRSCAAGSWFTEFRTLDDDDGNLANGTPHAAAIFAAFNRHNIPCGAAADATNQNHSSCPALPAPALAASGSAGQIALTWAAVPGASSYNVLRNDQGCDWGYTLLANVTGTTYTDAGLPDFFPLYYSVQPVGSDPDCVGTLSTCTTAHAGAPHASLAGSARVADTCSSGGDGSADTTYDPGEKIQFSISLRNDGATTLTGVTATLTPTTPGVTLVEDTVSFGSIVSGASAVSLAPPLSAHLPAGLACGSSVTYSVAIHANEGSWTTTLTQTAGLVDPGIRTALSESFSGGIPATWTIVDGGSGGGAAATWTTANPGARAFTAPLAAPVAMVDSFAAGSVPNTIRQDEELITPTLDLSAATSVTLDYDEFFRWNIGQLDEKGDVDVRSSLTGGAWVNVVRNRNSSNPASGTDTGAAHRTVSLTAQAAGASDVQIRFHYYDAFFEFWWEVDNVVVTYSIPPACAMHACATTADLRVTQSAPPMAAAGGALVYALQVDNAGPDPAESAQLSDAIPEGTTFQAITAADGWSCTVPAIGASGTIDCTRPVVPESSTASFTVTVRASYCAGDGTTIANTATIASTTSELDAADNSSLATTTLSDTGACDDGDACTQLDACQGGACVGSNPVVCGAVDGCHDAGSCNSTTGQCSSPVKADGTVCDDGSACTLDDACSAGACVGAPVGPPGEVTQFQFTTKSARQWSALAVVGPGVVYDVVRGALGAWPVGAGASEQCQASGIDETVLDVADDPGPDAGFWYLVRGRSACGAGSFGTATDGSERAATVCP